MSVILGNKSKFKVIWIVRCVALLGLVIGVETSSHFLNQSEEKLKQIVARSRTLSRAWTSYMYLPPVLLVLRSL